MRNSPPVNSLWYWEMLACPFCKCSLDSTTNSPIFCKTCQIEYPLGVQGQPDLRLNGIFSASLPVQYDPTLCLIPEEIWKMPAFVARYLPQASDLTGRPQADLKAWLLATIKPEMKVLDLGARSNRDKELVENLGGRYLAIEIAAPDAMILGDAHAIPLLDQSVDIVMSMSVFEHLKNPYLAAQEVKRVLKPGGHFIGIVGFLESVHGLPHGSYFHHSYLGIYALLTASKFKVHYLAAFHGWSAIHAISRAMLPGLSKRLAYLLIAPLCLLQDILWYAYGLKSGDVNAARNMRNRILSASVHFVATRPD
jgi:SAM-dependent methyltransferase